MHVKERDVVSYLENSLTDKKQKSMDKHFSVCALCRSKLRTWKTLYDTIETLDFDFKLNGLEDKVLRKIKTQAEKEFEKHVAPKLSASNLVFFLLLIFTASVFFTPVIDIVNKITQHSGNLMLNQGLRWLNEVKWHAIDFIGKIQAAEISFLFLSAGIMLMVGGVYLYIGNKPFQKLLKN